MTCNIEKTVSKAEGRIPNSYDLTMEELYQLYSMSKKGLFYAIIKAFDLGFIRGTRAKGKGRVSVL